MANHFIGLARGANGTAPSDFTTGAASTATLDVEVRIADVDQNGNVLTQMDVVKALDAIRRAILDRVNGGFPPL